MANRGDFGYGATGREYRDDPEFGNIGNPRRSPYQGSGNNWHIVKVTGAFFQ